MAWRSEYSKIDVWYATFGSKMWQDRFLCYIQGGQVEGMSNRCPGSNDKNWRKEILWRTYPHRLFFGCQSSQTWGTGGTAFVNPETSNDRAYFLLYKITAEQFNDVLSQLYLRNLNYDETLFSMKDLLKIVITKKYLTLEAIKSRYDTVLYLGNVSDLPVVTMTCSRSNFEQFKSGKLSMIGAAKTHAKVIIKGLVQGGMLTQEEAEAYIHEAETKPL